MAAAAAAAAGGAAAPPPPPPPAAAAAAARPAWNRLSARVACATALFVLGCAAAALAFFAMTLPRADTNLLGRCAPTDEEAAGLRAASEQLLLAASAQVLAGTAALLVPARPVSAFGCVLGGLTGYHASDVLGMLLGCHDYVRGVLAFHFWLFFIMLWVALIAGFVVSIH